MITGSMIGASFAFAPPSLLLLAILAIFVTRNLRFSGPALPPVAASRTWGLIALQYSLAVVVVVIAAVLRWWLLRAFGPIPIFITFYPAVLLVALIAGGGPGILASALSALLADYFWIQPYRTFAVRSPNDFLALTFFICTNLFLCVLAERLKRARWAEAVARQRELLSVTLASIGDGVIVTDVQGRITFLNGQAEHLTGWTLAQAQGQPLSTVFNIINEESRQSVENPVDKVLGRGSVVGLANHTILITRDGREIPIDDSGAPVRAVDGDMQGVVLVFRDFSERRKKEQELQQLNRTLRESEKRFRLLVETVKDYAIFMLDAQGRVATWNQAAEQMKGYTAGEILGQPFSRFHLPEDQAQDKPARELAIAMAQGRFTEENWRVRKDGSRFWADVTITALHDEAGELSGFTKVVHDVTERKRAAEALTESRGRLAAIIESAMDAIVTVDEQQRIVLFNPAAARMFRCPVDQVFGEPLDRLIPQRLREIHRQHVQRFGQTQQTARAMGHLQPLLGLRGDGEEFPVEASISQVDLGGKKLFSVILRDITQRQQGERELQAAKKTAEAANAAKDQFLAVLSHELRTPLTPVMATVFMLLQDPSFDPDTREDLEMIRRNVELEARLIDDLLDVTRIERGKVELDKRPMDLCAILRGAMDVCMPDIEARELHFAIDLGADGSYWVEADPARLQQVLWNLLKNSIKFTPKGGCVGIHCRRDRANHVIVEIVDSGEGIAPEVLPSIFDAFEQGDRRITRQFGGLGLGLAISKAITELHGGTITAGSQGKGKGATFSLRLPLLSPQTVVRSSPITHVTPAPASPTRPVRILLVEDHGDTATIIRRLLIAAGHQVQIAADISTALRLAGTQPFDLLLSDLGLPDGSGYDLMRALRKQGITTPGIALSGYGQEQDLQQSREAGFMAHIVKPVNLPRLSEAIAQAVGTA